MKNTQPHLKVGQYVKLGTCSQRKSPSEYKLYDWHEKNVLCFLWYNTCFGIEPFSRLFARWTLQSNVRPAYE